MKGSEPPPPVGQVVRQLSDVRQMTLAEKAVEDALPRYVSEGAAETFDMANNPTITARLIIIGLIVFILGFCIFN